MSVEDDTFEIDIYGDEPPATEEPVASGPAQQYEGGSRPTDVKTIDEQGHGEQSSAAPTAVPATEPSVSQTNENSSRSTKRSYDEHAMDDEHNGQGQSADNRPVEAGATTALKLAELHWWTTEEDLRAFCAECQTEEELCELAFGEHKINGKSKGEAYLEFETPQAASAVKRRIEEASQSKGKDGLRKTPFAVSFTPVGNPHRSTTAVGGVKKEYPQAGGQGGAYNNFHPRGNFRGRGNFNNRGGRGGYNNGGMQGQNNNQSNGWGMNNMGGGNFGGGFANPMMAGAFQNMAMGNFGNMARGGMANGMAMMGRGGFGGMGNMNMGGMMGGMMGGRGGWNGGGGQFQAQGGGNFAGSMQQGGNTSSNKRPRTDQ